MKRNLIMSIGMMIPTICLITLPRVAEAVKIHRSCEAKYIIQIQDARRQDESRFFNPLAFEFAYVTLKKSNMNRAIKGVGGCGQTVPNRCRRRAADALEQCAREHFSAPAIKPASCNKIKNYENLNNLQRSMQDMVCDHLEHYYGRMTYSRVPRPYSIVATPIIEIYGDKGCKRRKNFTDLRIHCSN